MSFLPYSCARASLGQLPAVLKIFHSAPGISQEDCLKAEESTDVMSHDRRMSRDPGSVC